MKTTQTLTDKLVKTISTNKKRINITDAITPGLKLRVSKTGHKSFALMIRDTHGVNRTHTIGIYPEISLKKAREAAQRMRVELKYEGESKPKSGCKVRKDPTTLRQLLDEVEAVFSINRKGWRPRGGKGSTSYVRGAIERVFSKLLDIPVESISAEVFGHTANSYIPIRPVNGKNTANGQVSRAISYLAPALDWASNRGKTYGKIGAGRKQKLDIADLSQINDPAREDPTIQGIRSRVLSAQEIKAIYPLLRYPAPEAIQRRNILPKDDFGPIALRFMLLTLARREEVANAKWEDIDFENGVWVKPLVKNVKGGLRSQRLPLSDSVLKLLRDLSGYKNANAKAFIFPNRNGGKIDNWNRITKQIYEGSGTQGWTRHDLRRTGATILEELGTPIQTIDSILDHTNRFANAGVSGSAGHYMIATRIIKKTEDPKAMALNQLNEALEAIVQSEDSNCISGQTDAFP
ncbi:tyrosine-type recombinase/integrase [Profundibacter sp.]